MGDQEDLAALAQARGWSWIASIPADEVLHSERDGGDTPVRDAWQWYDGPRRIVCGEVGWPGKRGHRYDVIVIDGVDRLPDCDVHCLQEMGNQYIWGNPIEPDEGTWPPETFVWSTAANADRVRDLIDVELVSLLVSRRPWALRIRHGRAVLQTRSPGRGPSAWEKRLSLIEALLVRDTAAGRNLPTPPVREDPGPTGNGVTWRP
ncbi:hypothetical protein [Nocardioides montaniterrae]